MTDKQIIIDGVDVAGCVRLQDDEISCDLGGECKGWENCYYKQLKRKEQECEELKETIDDFITDNSYLYSYDGKQPSNLDELQECMQSSLNEFVKYKQALDSIEHICRNVLDDDYIRNLAFALLDIINKVKDGDNSE